MAGFENFLDKARSVDIPKDIRVVAELVTAGAGVIVTEVGVDQDSKMLIGAGAAMVAGGVVAWIRELPSPRLTSWWTLECDQPAVPRRPEQ